MEEVSFDVEDDVVVVVAVVFVLEEHDWFFYGVEKSQAFMNFREFLVPLHLIQHFRLLDSQPSRIFSRQTYHSHVLFTLFNWSVTWSSICDFD